MTARHELDGSSRPVNIFSRPHRLQCLHKYTIFFKSHHLTFPKSVDFSHDGSSRTRRVVTTRQHFQPASPPPVSSQIHNFFLSPSPPDIFKLRVDFSHDGSSWTRRVVTNRHHFQSTSTFFQIATSCYFTSANTTTGLPLDRSSSPKSRPDSVHLYWTTLTSGCRPRLKPACISSLIKQETDHHQLAGGRPEEKVRRIFLARY